MPCISWFEVVGDHLLLDVLGDSENLGDIVFNLTMGSEDGGISCVETEPFQVVAEEGEHGVSQVDPGEVDGAGGFDEAAASKDRLASSCQREKCKA